MANINSSVGMIYTLTADVSAGEAGLKKFSSLAAAEAAKAGGQFAVLERSSANAASAVAANFTSIFSGSFFGNLASNIAQGFTNQLEAVGEKILGLGKSYADAGTAIYLASQKISLSAEALSVVKSAADVSGSSLEDFSAGFVKFEKNLAVGGDNIKSVFRQMGIDVAAGVKNPEEAFGQFLAKFRQLPDDANRAAVMVQLFGKAGANLVPTFLKLSEGGKSFAEIKQGAIDAGLAFDTVGAKKAKQLEDAFTALGKSGKGLMFGLAGGFAESLTSALNLATSVVKTLRPLFVDLGKYIGEGLGAAVRAVSSLIGYFSGLSPAAQKIAGTLSVVVGVIGSVAGAVAGLFAALSGSTILASVIGFVGTLATAFSEILIPIIAVGAAVAGLYLAWQTNFGGIRDYTFQVFEAVKSVVSGGMAAIYDLTDEVGGQIVDWWKENYPLIKETVQTVSDAIKSYVGAFLSEVAEFWKAHGEQITAAVKTAWDFVSSYIKSTVEAVGSIIKAVMQAINGDWNGAWETFGKIVGRWLAFSTDTVKSALTSVGIWIKNNFTSIMSETGNIVETGIAKIVKAFRDLPITLAGLTAKFILAGASVAEAIYKGFREGSQPEASASGNYAPPNNPETNSGPGADGSQQAKANESPLSVNFAADDERKEQEKAAQKDAAALIKIWENYGEKVGRVFDESKTKLAETFNQTKNAEQYKADLTNLISDYIAQMNKVDAVLYPLLTNQAAEEKKTVHERALVEQEFQNKKNVWIDRYTKAQDEANKKITESTQKEADNQTKIEIDKLNKSVELREAASKKVLARIEADKAAGNLDEDDARRGRQGLQANFTPTDKRTSAGDAQNTAFQVMGADGKRQNFDIDGGLLKYKKDQLVEQLKLVKAGSDEEVRINVALAKIKEEIETEYYNQKKENAEADSERGQKTADDERKRIEDLAKLRLEVLQTENDIKSFQREQDRKILENSLDYAPVTARLKGLTDLRDFDLAENERQRAAEREEANAAHEVALGKIKDAEKEKETVQAINDLLAARLKLIDAQRDGKTQEITAGSQTAIDQAKMDSSGGGFLGGILKSAGVDAKGLAEPLNTLNGIGQMLGSTFGQVASAVGNTVRSFVLLGSAGGGFRKFAAEVIASIAQMAAVQALFELAQGLAMLALAYFGLNPKAGASAGAHFAAAAEFGVIAGVAATAGRITAGSSFQNQSSSNAFSSANNTNAASSQTANSNAGKPGEYYSSRGDDVIERTDDRRSQSDTTHTINLVLPKGMVESHILDDIRRLGPIKQAFVKITEA